MRSVQDASKEATPTGSVHTSRGDRVLCMCAVEQVYDVSTHPSRTSVKSDQGFFGVESVMRVNADSLLIRAAATSTSGTLNDLTTDLIMANNNNMCVSV